MSNAPLRRARRRAHRAFDQMWRRLGMQRTAAYRWLADRLGIPVDDCHMARMDIPTCRRVVELCQGFNALPDSFRRPVHSSAAAA